MPTARRGATDEVASLPLAGDDECVTVVVPARDEENEIEACLDGIRAQTYRNLQIIVVDGGSVDRTAELVRGRAEADPRIELLHNDRNLIAISLNAAVARARGRWLVRIDAHSVVGPQYVAHAVSRLREGNWGGVGGRKDGVGTTAAGRAIAAAMGSRFGVGGSLYHYGTAAREVDHVPFGAYPVELVKSLGGWDERLTVNQDYEFDLRVRRSGRPLLFDPRLVIHWQSRQSVGALFRQYRRYGRGKVDVVALHPGSMSPRHVIPPAFLGYLAAAGFTTLRRPTLGMAMLAPYLLGLGAASSVVGRRLETPRERAWIAPAFVAMHVGWGLGFWSGIAAVAGRRMRRLV